jgi:hypothetical protein
MYYDLSTMTQDMSFIIVMIYGIQINTIQYNTIGEAECVEETVLVHVECLQGEDSGMKARTQSDQGIYNGRNCCIGICVLLCAVGILLWGVYDCGG